MNVILYNNSSENHCINKALSVIYTTVAVAKDVTDVETPELILEYTGDIKSVNYLYIQDFDRYYFVNNASVLRGSRYLLKCSIDVLESFKNDILALTCIIDKQQSKSKANMYLDDGSYVMTSKETVDVINFPSGFNESGSFILICAGGK